MTPLEWAAIRQAWLKSRQDFKRLIIDTRLLRAYVRDKTQRGNRGNSWKRVK